MTPIFTFAQNCDLNFTYQNTGSNMTVMINEDALVTDVISVGDSLGAFMNLDGQWHCVGAIKWTGTQYVLSVWGNDSSTDSQDGLMPFSPVILKAKSSSGVVYDVSYIQKLIILLTV